MTTEIEEKIKQALSQTTVNGEYDFFRFKAATQDLLADNPQERKFFSRIADEKFWSICMRAKTEDASEAKEAERIAAKYLQDEYGISPERAAEMSKYTVRAIFVDSNGVSIEKNSIEKRREETRRKLSALEQQSKSATDERVLTVHHPVREIDSADSKGKTIRKPERDNYEAQNQEQLYKTNTVNNERVKVVHHTAKNDTSKNDKKADNLESKEEQLQRVTEKQESIGKENNRGTEKRSNKSIYLAILLLLVLVCAAALFAYMSRERELEINGGEDIEFYAGEDAEIQLSGDGLPEDAWDKSEWYSDENEKLDLNEEPSLSVKESALGDNDNISLECDVEVKEGIKKWKGTVNIIAKRKPQKLKNGKILKKPSNYSKGTSTITVKNKGDKKYCFYLKNEGEPRNDLEFTVGSGKTVVKDVPYGEYIVYQAEGTTWYGKKYLFGQYGDYVRNKDKCDFTNYYWTYTQNGGGYPAKDYKEIELDDFPGRK